MRYGLLLAAVLLLCGFVFRTEWTDRVTTDGATAKVKKEKDKKEKKEGGGEPASPGIAIEEQWALPDRLKEVSGIAYVDEQRFACVQDEEGTVFLYNRQKGAIEKEIPFAAAGDYEGIALNGQTAYVVRSDGQLYEVPLNGGSVKTYSTPLTARHNVEGLCYDAAGNRLLLAIKDKEPGGQPYKGIYAFRLDSKTMDQAPVLRIHLEDPVLSSGGKKKGKGVQPSAIGIHPVHKTYYIVDGPQSRLLIMDGSGAIKEWLPLGKAFEQPEGITFSPDGALFISNEGVKDPANIMQVQLQ